MWFVYFVRCVDGSLYCGITNDLKGRVLKHNKGTGAKYTRSRRPVVLVWWEAVGTRSATAKIEHQLKKLPRIEKEKLIFVSAK